MDTSKRRISRIPDVPLKRPAKSRRPTDSSVKRCNWIVSSNSGATCSESCSSSQELFQHVTTRHVSHGGQGFSCKWDQCGSNFSSNNQEDFQKHISTHIFKSIAKAHRQSNMKQQVSAEDSVNESSEVDIDGDGDSDSDYDVSADRKARKASKRTKKRKNASSDASVAKINKTSDNPSVVKASDKVIAPLRYPETSFFYKFSCEWYASPKQYGVESATSKPIKCHRKLTNLNEAIEHLQNHHIARLTKGDEPLRCAWQECDSGEFSDEEGLNEHVTHHAMGNQIHPQQNGTFRSSSADTGGKAIKKDPGVTWYTCALHSLLNCDVPSSISECRNNNTCYFCRYSTLQESAQRLGATSSVILSEFRDLLPKFSACKDNPFKFISCFVALATDHEEIHHKSELYKDMFWIEDIKESDLKCKKHTDNDLASFFPPLYKKCNVCLQNSERWPTAKKKNLILALDTSTPTTISEIIFVKGWEYQLRAVLGQDPKTGTFYTVCDRGNKWTAFPDNSLKASECEKMRKGRGACMVIYSNVNELPIPNDIPDSNLNELVDSRSVSPDAIQTNWAQRNEAQQDATVSPVNTPRTTEECTGVYHICCRKGGDFDSVLSQRKLKNKSGVDSCINSVIQALITTGLSVILPQMCLEKNNCFLCHVMSVSQHVHASKGRSTEPFELQYNRAALGLPPSAEGKPVDYIKRLLTRMASDEATKHHSCDEKYKLMIRFQRKCPCRESYEALYWIVNPSKKNESLNDLMAQHSLYCDKCHILNFTEAVQLPEILIITVESAGIDYSLHYPDEMSTPSCRYFLTAIIVSDDKGSHFFTYCRVFGKWILYDDDKECRQISSGEVLDLRTNIQVLVYVTRELTPNDVRLFFPKFKTLKEELERRRVVVKQERED